MKKIRLSIINTPFVFLFAHLLLTACGSDENGTSSENKEVNVAKAVEFKVDLADFNEAQETDVTRAANKEIKLEQETVDLGNGILAEATLQRDTTKQAKRAATRVIPNDTYTMLAYDRNTNAYKGDIKGTVTSGVFTPTSVNKDLILSPGEYNFVLFNSKVSRNGNNLTVTRANADAALIGRTTQTINSWTPKQQVSFTLKHVGAKIKIKLTGYMNFTNASARLEAINSTDVPGSSVYDASTGTWSTGPGANFISNITYGATQALTGSKEGRYAVTGNQEISFMPGTDVSKLKLTLRSGKIYNINMNATSPLVFKPASTLKLEQNGSYVLNVNLAYSFLYLMSDGDTGFINKTIYGGGTKTPIGVVVSQSRHLAIALRNAGGNTTYKWCSLPDWNLQKNKNMKSNYQQLIALENGEYETWDATASMDNVTVKGSSPNYPAFKAAGDYSPSVSVSGGMIGRRWYLPAYGEWKYVFSALGFGENIASKTTWGAYNWYGILAQLAFTQVGGEAIQFQKYYWTASECIGFHAGYIYPYKDKMHFGNTSKDFSANVRPFIKFP